MTIPVDPAAAARVRRALGRRGVPADEVDRAIAEGRIEQLAVAQVAVRGPARFTAAEAAARAGVAPELVERLWLALGFPPAGRGEVSLGDADVAALLTVHRLVERGIVEEEAIVQLARVLGSAMARLAEALVGSQPGRRPGDGDRLAYTEAVLASRDTVLDQTSRLVEYTFRRHLQAAALRALSAEVAADGVAVANYAVGFADLVGYTSLSQQLGEDALGAVIGRFEQLAYDIVTSAGGRVIKTIGDEVMFVASDPAQAMKVALALSEGYADDDLLSQVRVGLATGPVLARDGDYYGAVVNLASRLVTVAFPGTVVVSADMHEALADAPDLAWRALRRRHLKDIGTVPVWAVYRSGGKPPAGATPSRYGPLRSLLSDAGIQRAQRRAVVAAVEAAVERAEAAVAEPSDAELPDPDEQG